MECTVCRDSYKDMKGVYRVCRGSSVKMKGVYRLCRVSSEGIRRVHPLVLFLCNSNKTDRLYAFLSYKLK